MKKDDHYALDESWRIRLNNLCTKTGASELYVLDIDEGIIQGFQVFCHPDEAYGRAASAVRTFYDGLLLEDAMEKQVQHAYEGVRKHLHIHHSPTSPLRD